MNSVLGLQGKFLLDVEEIVVTLDGRQVLSHASLSIQRGESVSVRGASGSGKSTLLSVILGLRKPDKGTVTIGGVPMRAGLGARATRLRRESIGMLFQDHYLVDTMTAADNVMLPAMLVGRRTEDARRAAVALLGDFGLTDPDRQIRTYSGGERQRISIARALINEPQILLADEPTGSLDPANRGAVINALISIPERRGCSILLVTHDPIVATSAQRALVLEGGKLTEARTDSLLPASEGRGA
ncbi:phosphonate-transporting ATPase [Actinomyces denticolens]|uniref:ABC transporter ATP-binding protein n=1 Tax=Actinomyces TaxID=1654 RepID=UPI0009823FEA|nr:MULTISPECIES: ABC transporter ATP-binding protein [Actinomyces]GAV95444.1 phosphonate-transporting ATPase [Actinomyces denticolens]